jgi:DNA mismatch repair protein MSH2
VQSLVIQLSVKEAIVPSGTATGKTDRDIDLAQMKVVLDRCGVVVTERKPSKAIVLYVAVLTSDIFEAEFMVKNLSCDLIRLLNGSESEGISSADATVVIRT